MCLILKWGGQVAVAAKEGVNVDETTGGMARDSLLLRDVMGLSKWLTVNVRNWSPIAPTFSVMVWSIILCDQ